MDAKPPRVAYSFDSGTFDLRSWCPGLWLNGEDGNSTLVRLDGRWDALLGKLSGMGGVLASVRSGPLNLAGWWEHADFQAVPGSHDLVELNTGTELRRNALGSATAVVEECEGQQLASLQFFSRENQGCLKLMLTQVSNLDAFESLVQEHAVASIWGAPVGNHKRSEGKDLNVREPQETFARPERDQVLRLWGGLGRSRPSRYFPGLGMVPRLAALDAAGQPYSWRLKEGAERLLLELMTEQAVEMDLVARNRAVFMPSSGALLKSNLCGCGQTFFGWQTQLTLRRCCGSWTACAVRTPTKHGERWNLELYDDRGEFSGSISPGRGASMEVRQRWEEALQAGAEELQR